MSADTVSLATAEHAGASKSNLVRNTLRNPLGAVGAVLLTLVVLAAVAAPLIAPVGPDVSSLDDVYAPISPEHPLGGDSAGRDLLARLVWGARISLGGAVLAVVVAMLIGVPIGLIGGYYGRAFDVAANWVSDLIIALPGIVILLSLRVVIGPSVWLAMLIFGVLLAPSFYRLVRGAVVNVKNELYVDAARVAGLSDPRIISRHVLGVVRGPIIIQASMILAIALFIQAGLEFLGLGDRQQASWGSMLNEGFANIFRGPQLLFWPGLALTLTCAALALLANAVRDALSGGDGPKRRRTSSVTKTAHNAYDPREVSILAEPIDPLLQVQDLRISYPGPDGSDIEVVHGVTLGVASGEIVGLVGESGSGKTQTSLAVLGLLSPGGQITSGEIRLDGVQLTPTRTRQLLGREIAYIPQEPLSNLDPAYTVGSQLVEPLRVVGRLSKAEAKARAIELLSNVGIADPERVFSSYPHQISGGMAQRVLIAGAVALNPRLLIADEPSTALDVTVQAEILDVLRALQKDRDMAVLFVTHNFGVVADLCDRVYVMRAGVVVESNDTLSLFESPHHPYTQHLLGHILEGGPPRAILDRHAERSGS